MQDASGVQHWYPLIISQLCVNPSNSIILSGLFHVLSFNGLGVSNFVRPQNFQIIYHLVARFYQHPHIYAIKKYRAIFVC